MTGCAVPGCKNRSENGKAFYSIPLGQSVPERRRRIAWLLRMGRDRPASRSVRICEDHFTDDQFENYLTNGKRKLRRNAMPSIFPSKEPAPSKNTPSSGCGASDSKPSSVRVQPNDETGQVDQGISSQPGEPPRVYSPQEDEPIYIDDPGKENVVLCSSADQSTSTSSIHSATITNSAPSTSVPAKSAKVPTPLHSETIVPMQPQTTVLLQDIGAPSATYAVTYLIPNHGAFRMMSHVAVPAPSMSGTTVPNTQVVPVSLQPPVVPAPSLSRTAVPNTQVVPVSCQPPSVPASSLSCTNIPNTRVVPVSLQPPAVPAPSVSLTTVPNTPNVPVAMQPPAASPLRPMKPPKTEREKQLERMLDLEYKKRRKAEEERDELRHSLKRVLADDQVRVLEKGTMKGSSWSHETIQKALQLKVMCGGRVYDYVKSYVVPLPSRRTLQKLVEKMKAADREVECPSDEREGLSDEEVLFDEIGGLSDDQEGLSGEEDCPDVEITISEEDAG
ncbi:hypothetical protein MTO96_032140 [Rhipicephalus appendiculatus]